MKKLFLITLVIMFTFLLTACSAFEEKYPVSDPETGGAVFTLIDVQNLIDEAIAEYEEEVNEELEMQQEAIILVLDYMLLLNDKMVILNEIGGEETDEQFAQLKQMYGQYFMELYPDYFNEEDMVDEAEVYNYSYEDMSIEVVYDIYNFVIVIRSVEVFGEDWSEFIKFTQTDYVLTVEEFEAQAQGILEKIYNNQ